MKEDIVIVQIDCQVIKKMVKIAGERVLKRGRCSGEGL